MRRHQLIRVIVGLTMIVQTQAQTTTRVSVDSAGNQANDASWDPLAISPDGSTVAFHSVANNLVPGDTTPSYFFDVFVHELATGQTSRVSVSSGGSQSNGSSVNASLSTDGRYVSFISLAPELVATDTNGTYFDVFAAPNPCLPPLTGGCVP
jgi:Tol biopolymer transport system component